MGFPGFLLSAARSVAATLDVKPADVNEPTGPRTRLGTLGVSDVQQPASIRRKALAEATRDCAPSPEP